MPGRQRTKLVVAGVLGLAIVGGVVVGFKARGRRGAAPSPTAAVAFDARQPLAELAEGLRQGDARALAALYQKVAPNAGERSPAVGESEAGEWSATLDALRSGYPKFGAYGRGAAMMVTALVLDRFTIEPAPTHWTTVPAPAFDLFASGLNDNDANVRVAALVEIGKLWSWKPNRTLITLEENAIADWKAGIHHGVVRQLARPEVKVRVAAVACLGVLPIDSAAAPAVAYVEDPSSVEVRQQVLSSFAARPELLTDEAILKRIYDPEPALRHVAELVLKARGLTDEQVSLGAMIFHPKPEMRASVIALLRNRTDIDPNVWLLELSRDRDETVRSAAVGALAERLSPEVRQRLNELARRDPSPSIRQAARQAIPANPEATAALPPLPPGFDSNLKLNARSTPNLNPKAN